MIYRIKHTYYCENYDVYKQVFIKHDPKFNSYTMTDVQSQITMFKDKEVALELLERVKCGALFEDGQTILEYYDATEWWEFSTVDIEKITSELIVI